LPKVNSNIITKKMAKTIGRLLNNIVLGLDRILNKTLKTYGLLTVLWLIDIAKAYFIISYYLRLRKAIITFILRKEGKVDYLFLESYRFIILKNTLSKILERVVVDYIVNTAKEYTLFTSTIKAV
jgi:cytochrome c oxidase subunit IV